jgi:lysophospholipase L1-like esterase
MNAALHHPGGKRFQHVVLACCALFVGALFIQVNADVTLSIMPLGDSLTWGYDGGPDTPQYLDSLDTGGYRSPLYLALGAAGVNVNYMGSSTGNPSPVLTAAGQTAQDGYNGYRIDDIANNLAASVPGSDGVSNSGGFWLTSQPQPNIILLQAGANDIGQDYDPLYTGAPGTENAAQMGQDTATRMIALINQILVYDPNTWIFTDGTTPMVNTTFNDAAANDYAIDLDSMIAADYGSSTTQHVVYVDIHDAIVHDGYFGLFTDGVHLNTAGYAVVADTWETAIMDDYNFADIDSVPEPSTWVLFIGGGVALVGWRKLRTRKS